MKNRSAANKKESQSKDQLSPLVKICKT